MPRLLLLVFCLFFVPVVKADPITAGELIVLCGSQNRSTFNLSGPGLSLNGITTGGACDRVLRGIFPNDVVHASASFGTSDPTLNLREPFIIGGVEYPVILFGGNLQGSALHLKFLADGSAFAPNDGSPGFILYSPFSLIPVDSRAHPALQTFSVELSGQGTARLTYHVCQGGGVYCLAEAIYTFGPTPDGVTVVPTPEPATLFLLSIGLVGFALWRRR